MEVSKANRWERQDKYKTPKNLFKIIDLSQSQRRAKNA